MIIATRLAWMALAAIHLLPALSLGSDALRQRLYGMRPQGDLAVLLAHRSLIFAALVVASLTAAFVTRARFATAIPVTISVMGFLLAYSSQGAPAGPLRQIAWIDLAATPLLALVWWDAWRR